MCQCKCKPASQCKSLYFSLFSVKKFPHHHLHHTAYIAQTINMKNIMHSKNCTFKHPCLVPLLCFSDRFGWWRWRGATGLGLGLQRSCLGQNTRPWPEQIIVHRLFWRWAWRFFGSMGEDRLRHFQVFMFSLLAGRMLWHAFHYGDFASLGCG